ncbi:M24 family metallopeptidase [Streptomyces canus]|uniref:M24 family metallopeptidase n=1 Tax=Streptomyces canus TaxID=58343 RepID=UPI0033A54950
MRRTSSQRDRAGYGEHATELTGHGIGITAHEPPYLTESGETCLVPGMCLSIGSGVYLPGRFGVRIADVVACTEDGAGDSTRRTGRWRSWSELFSRSQDRGVGWTANAHG